MARPASLLAALLALAPLAHAGGAQARDGGAVDARLARALAEPASGDAVAGDLAALGPAAAPDLLAALCAGATAGGRPLGPELEAAVLAALAAQPPGVLRAAVGARATPEAGARERVACLRALGAGGEAEDVGLLARLAAPAEGEPRVPRARRDAFEAALGRIVLRDRAGLVAVQAAFPGLDPALTAAAARCAGLRGDEEALAALAGLLGRAEGADPALLAEIGRVAERVPRPVDRALLVLVRRHLRAEDESEAVLAARALGRLEDFDAAGELIALLGRDSGRPRLAAAAADALAEMTGRPLGKSRRAWERWHDEELAWWDGRAGTVLADLQASDPTVVLRAMREAAGRGLYRHEVAAALAPVLERPEEELARSACAILARLGSPAAVPALLDALEREPAIAASAAAALAEITGASAPPSAAAWRAELERETFSGR